MILQVSLRRRFLATARWALLLAVGAAAGARAESPSPSQPAREYVVSDIGRQCPCGQTERPTPPPCIQCPQEGPAIQLSPEGPLPSLPTPESIAEDPTREAEESPLAGITPNEFDSSSAGLPSGLGAVAASESPNMHMVGDFFGGGYFLGDFDGFSTAPSAGGDRRFKATDNLNPLPTDRFFFNYHHFHNAVSDVAGKSQNVDRFTFGLERTFLDKMMSIEMRIPFAGGLDGNQIYNVSETTTSEFGNLTFTFKILLCEVGSFLSTAGIATVVPTAEDASVESDSRITILENDAVHLQPYLGLTYFNPCRRLFSTSYVAVDVDVNGNSILTGLRPTPGAPFNGPLTPLGAVRDQTLLFADWQIGYWCYRDYGHIGYLNAIAPVFEVHYTRALENADNLPVYQNPFGKVDLVNLTAGLVFDFRRTASVTVYGAAPLRREKAFLFGRAVSPVFQSEVGVQCAYRY